MNTPQDDSCVCCDHSSLAKQATTDQDVISPLDTAGGQGRRRFLKATAAVAIGVGLGGSPIFDPDAGAHYRRPSWSYWRRRPRASSVVIANRGSGDISVINARNFRVNTIDLPGDAEPMYVNHDSRRGRVFVGDRASSTVVALDDRNYHVVGSVDVGAGVFHQWLDVNRRQLWVVGTEASTVTVVDPDALAAITTFAIPSDLIDRGGVTHDVFVRGQHAFVSILGLDDGSGAVLQYSTRNFELTGRIETGGDPHLFVRNGVLYVPAQQSSTVSAYNASSLRPLNEIDVPNAHGIWVTPSNAVIVSNIAGGGTDALSLLRSASLRPIRTPIDTSIATPHNVAVNRRGLTFVTHSGPAATQVSVVNPRTGWSWVVNAGTNPFGLAVVE